MWFKLHFCRAHASAAYKAHRASSSSQQQQQPVAVFTLKHLQAEVTNKYGPAHFDKVSFILFYIILYHTSDINAILY
jgi:hypothetical protein